MYEVVPCQEVGLVLRFVFLTLVFPTTSAGCFSTLLSPSFFRYLSGRVFVVELTPGSQAHVDKFITPGDIIDEINGTSLRNSKNGQVRKPSNTHLT